MADYQEGTRIITLAPTDDTDSSEVRVATFEEAFGEHSEWRGRGRARRQARRASRQQHRRDAKQARLDAREARKDERHQRKRDRKSADEAAKNAPEDAPADAPTDSSGQPAGAPSDSGQGGGASGAPDGAPDSGGSGGGGATADNSQLNDPASGGGGNGGGGETEQSSGDSGGSTDPSDDSAGIDDEASNAFDAAPYNPHETFPSANEDNQEFSEAEGGKTPVHPDIQAIAHAIAENKEVIMKLEKSMANIEKESAFIQKNEKASADKAKKLHSLSDSYAKSREKLEKRRERIVHLEEILKHKHGEHHPHIKQAHKNAESKIQREKEGKMAAKDAVATKKNIKTLVQSELRPKFSTNKIVVPAVKAPAKKASFDAGDRYYSTSSRTVELQSNADGSGSAVSHTVMIKRVVIVAAVVVVLYYANKHKVFQKMFAK